MHFSRKSLIIGLALTSGLMAAPFHRITLPKEHVAFHNNQILIQLDGAWVSVEELHSDGKRLHGPKIRDPLMSRCSRVALEADLKRNVFRLEVDFDPSAQRMEKIERNRRERREDRDNQQNEESSRPEESRHYAERDQDY